MTNPYYKQHWIEIEPERQRAYDQILSYHPALDVLIRPLDLKPGLRVLDVGSGPGHTTMELARRVTPGGLVTGVDINADFITAASGRAHKNNLPIEYLHSEFPPLRLDDRSFDRVFCKNVLEYVDSAAETVKEMARVAAPGAVVVAIDSDWAMLSLDLPPEAQEISDRILAAARSIAVKEPRIGRMLYRLFAEAGLSDLKVEVFAGADVAGRSSTMLKVSLAQYARDSGQVAEADIQRWLRDLDAAIARRRYLMVLPQFVVRGSKPAAAHG